MENEEVNGGFYIHGPDEECAISVQEMAQDFAKIIIRRTFENIEKAQIEKCKSLQEQASKILADKENDAEAITLYNKAIDICPKN